MTTIAVREKGTKGFLLFVKKAFPTTYRVMRQQLQTGARLSGLGITDPTKTASEAPMSKSLADTLRDIAQVAAQTYLTKKQIDAQNRILNVQLQRAQSGQELLPIDPATYGLPSPSIGVGLTGDTKQTLLWIGGGVAALWVLSMFMGRRRA